jgi:hypothetical protein
MVAVYDLAAKKWLDIAGEFDGPLKDAKTNAMAKAAALIGRKLPDLKWH